MSQVRAACLVAAGVWIGLHVTLGVMYVDAVRSLPLFVGGLLALVSATWVATRPLVALETPETRTTTLVLTVSVPLIELLNLLGLRDGAAASYANWAAGGTGVILASLVLRGHGLSALLSGAGLVVVQTSLYAAAPGPDGFDPATALLLALPPQLWLLASWGVRRLLRAADALTAQLNTRAATSATDAAAKGYWAEVRADRLRELEASVLPFLVGVAEGRYVGTRARDRADRLALELRDGLRARTLLDGQVRQSVADARARGVLVSLTSDPESGAVSTKVRDLLPEVLALPGLRSLSLRATADPPGFTCVLTGVAPEVAALVGRAVSGSDARVTDADGSVVVSWVG